LKLTRITSSLPAGGSDKKRQDGEPRQSWPRITLPAPLERSAAVSKTSRSAWEVRRRRELAACCGWSRTTQPRSVPTARGEGRVRGHSNSIVSGSLRQLPPANKGSQNLECLL